MAHDNIVCYLSDWEKDSVIIQESQKQERLRIRKEFLKIFEASPASPPHLYKTDIDRICPEE